MTATKFTPGPWSVVKDDDCDEVQYLVVSDEVTIANCSMVMFPDGINEEANAHLIAASPDLYAELEASTNALEILRGRLRAFGDKDTSVDHQINNNRAALKKARGE